MKNKTPSLDFTNVCNIRSYLVIAIRKEIGEYRRTRKNWGVTSSFAKGRRQYIGEMITAYRAAKTIEIKY
jgi:hypothetical protein